MIYRTNRPKQEYLNELNKHYLSALKDLVQQNMNSCKQTWLIIYIAKDCLEKK